MRKHGKLIQGVGINDAGYSTTVVKDNKVIFKCPYYKRWSDMLKRCYSSNYHESRPTYKDCSVSEEWLTFSNFKVWMEAQDWEGKHLDKDIISEGNRVYSCENCVFIHPLINNFTLTSSATRGEYLLGVFKEKGRDSFRVNCCSPFSKKCEKLGSFSTELEAHLAWRKRKHELALQLADSEYVTDERIANALRTRYL